jgi:DNA polymerase III epsilon subunit family exonuclease
MPSALTKFELIAFDLETTGFSAETCEIVELGAVRFTADGREIGRFQQLVNPQTPIPWEATNVHGITDRMVSGQPVLGEVLPEFLAFLSGAPSLLMAHNAPFDLRFLAAGIQRTRVRKVPGHPVVDTLRLARARLPHLRYHKLQDLCSHFDITTPKAHRALHDSLVVKDVFVQLTRCRPVVTSLEDVFELAKPKTLGR